MTTEKKHREFWIWGFKIGPDESISQNCLVNLDKGGSEWYQPVHHVIEYSAYEQLQKENEEIKIKMSGAAGATVGTVSREYNLKIEKLTKALMVAEAALESMQVYSFYSKDMDWFHECNRYGLISRQALAEIKKLKGET